MKSLSLLAFTSLLLLSSFNKSSQIIELPITMAEGYANILPGFGPVGNKQLDSTDTWFRAENHVLKGIPTDWDKVIKRTISFDMKQKAFQSYKQGILSEEHFNDLKIAWNMDLEKRSFSEKPIKCFVYILHGKKNGVIVYKVDTDNDYDFSDEEEFSPPKFDFFKRDSLARQFAHRVKYEGIQNGNITELTAPVFLFKAYNALMANIPQHAEANLNGTKIIISSDGFSSMSYDPVTIKESTSELAVEAVKENEYITIGGDTYQNLGVDISRQVLQMKRVPKGEVVYSSQVGFSAIPFSGNDFLTQEKLSLEKYKGKFLFLDFWATWCGPCVEDLPNLKNAFNSIDKARIEFLGIVPDKAEPLKKMLEEKKIGWKQIRLDNEDGIVDDYNVNGFPTSFLIDPNGKIAAKNLRGENLTDTLNYYINMRLKK